MTYANDNGTIPNAMTTKVTSDLFKGLRNPYTGEVMEVIMTVNPGREPVFSSPGTYSTGDSFDTSEECIAAWNRRDGVSGLKTGMPIVCAYTKEPLRLVQGFGGKWRFVGGFDPHMFFARDEFLRLANMRDGVSSHVVSAGVRVTSVRESPRVTDAQRKAADAKTPSLDDGKLHELEDRLNARGIRVEPTSVRVPGRKGRRGR